MIKWLTMPKYVKQSGLSKEMVLQLIEKGDITAERTEGGHWRIKIEENPEILELKEEIGQLTDLVTTLCRHLGVSTRSEVRL